MHDVLNEGRNDTLKLFVTMLRSRASLNLLLPALLFASFGIRLAGAQERVCKQNLAPGAGTIAIQTAIDTCSRAGGGRLDLRAGEYNVAPIALRNHVHLYLAAGVVVRGIADEAAYPVTMHNIWQGKPQDRPLALIGAVGQTDVALMGEGVVDGNGAGWWKHYHELRAKTGEEMARPWMVQFTRCSHVLIDGVQLRDSPSYTLVAYLSKDVTVRGVKITAPEDSPNTDGVVAYSSQHVTITGVTVDSGDDNVAIKSSQPIEAKPGDDFSTYDITVRDSTFLRGHGATIGADTGGGIHDVRMENISFQGTQNGLRIKSGREIGGDVSHIAYRHITMKNTSPAVAIVEYYPRIPSEADSKAAPTTPLTPRFHDIELSDVTATDGAEAGMIMGLPESPAAGIVFDNVHISAHTGLMVRDASVTLHPNSKIQASAGESVLTQRGASISQH
jgi:polygalacturonase